MTILLLQKKQKYPKICYRGIAEKIAEKHKISIGQVNKLIPTLKSKEKSIEC